MCLSTARAQASKSGCDSARNGAPFDDDPMAFPFRTCTTSGGRVMSCASCTCGFAAHRAGGGRVVSPFLKRYYAQYKRAVVL